MRLVGWAVLLLIVFCCYTIASAVITAEPEIGTNYDATFDVNSTTHYGKGP